MDINHTIYIHKVRHYRKINHENRIFICLVWFLGWPILGQQEEVAVYSACANVWDNIKIQKRI